MAATPPDDLLGTTEVARLIGRSVPTVNRMVLDGRLRIVRKLPGRTGGYLFKRKDVERFLRDEAVSTTRKAS